MTDIHAAIGRVQLTKVGRLDRARARRTPRSSTRTCAASSCRRSPTAPCTSTTSTRSGCPRTATGSSRALKEEHSVGSGVYYPIPNHRLPSLAPSRRACDLPETERAAREVRLAAGAPVADAQDDLERIVDGGQRASPGRAPDGRRCAPACSALGMMGRHHARVLRELDGVELVAVADPGGDPHGVAGGLRGAARRRGADRRRASTSRSSRCPRASTRTPRSTLAEAGVHTLVEKPHRRHASSRAARWPTPSQAAGLVGAVGHIERFNPALQELRARLAAGDLGEVYQIATRRQGPFPARIADVGVVKDLGHARHRPDRLGRPERLRRRSRRRRRTRAAASTRT